MIMIVILLLDIRLQLTACVFVNIYLYIYLYIRWIFGYPLYGSHFSLGSKTQQSACRATFSNIPRLKPQYLCRRSPLVVIFVMFSQPFFGAKQGAHSYVQSTCCHDLWKYPRTKWSYPLHISDSVGTKHYFSFPY